MTATTGVGGLIYGRALVDQSTGKKINFDELGGGNIPEDITDLIASKAPIESPSLTGTPTAPTAAQGTNSTQIANTAFVKAAITALINGAPGTLDTLKEIAAAINNDPNFSTTINNALALKAPLASPALTGIPTAPTAAQGTNNTQIATTAYVRAAISALVDSSPEALDTLNELAAALGNDPNFATTIMNALAGKQPLSDVLTAISELTQRADNLLCFNQDGNASLSPLSEKARSLLAQDIPEAMRHELELAVSATMEPQSDIYDRTAGCLAIPGGFGFGALFTDEQEMHFSAENGPTEFLQWVRETPPGRYLVSQYDGNKKAPIINGSDTLNFSGYLDIEVRTNTTPENQQNATKQVIFKGINGESYTATIHSNITPVTLPDSWVNELLKVDDFTQVLRSSTGNSWGSPDIGGLMLGAYLGEAESNESIRLYRGMIVPGSRIGQIGMMGILGSSATSNSTPKFYLADSSVTPQSGSFVALSGNNRIMASSKFYYVGLFMRVA